MCRTLISRSEKQRTCPGNTSHHDVRLPPRHGRSGRRPETRARRAQTKRFAQLTNLVLPSDMMSLAFLDVRGNQLTRLTLPQGVTKLTALFVDGNPLTAFVLSEPLAATKPIGAFQFTIAGPPGAYAVDASPDLVNWIELNVSTNTLGKFVLTDGIAHLSPQKFYRARTIP